MFHYTWGTVFKDSSGKKIWEFDKRTYTDEIIQREVIISASSSDAASNITITILQRLSTYARASPMPKSAAVRCEKEFSGDRHSACVQAAAIRRMLSFGSHGACWYSWDRPLQTPELSSIQAAFHCADTAHPHAAGV